MAPNMQGPLINSSVMGRRMRALRIMAGHDRVQEAVESVEQLTGVGMSARTLYAIERGDQLPTAEQYFAIVLAYRPPDATLFFAPALREDLLSYLTGEYTREPPGPTGR